MPMAIPVAGLALYPKAVKLLPLILVVEVAVPVEASILIPSQAPFTKPLVMEMEVIYE